MDSSKVLPFKFIRKFDQYDICYSAEATRQLGKPHWFTKSAYVFFLGDKFSNRFVYVPCGFYTDGATVPLLFQPILSVWGAHGAGVILHDRLCETGYALEVNESGDVSKIKLTRKEIDDIFIESLKVIDANNHVIRLVDLGFGIHRTAMRPPVPNPNKDKDRFQDRWILDNKVYNIREEEVVDYLGVDELKFMFEPKKAA